MSDDAITPEEDVEEDAALRQRADADIRWMHDSFQRWLAEAQARDIPPYMQAFLFGTCVGALTKGAQLDGMDMERFAAALSDGMQACYQVDPPSRTTH